MYKDFQDFLLSNAPKIAAEILGSFFLGFISKLDAKEVIELTRTFDLVAEVAAGNLGPDDLDQAKRRASAMGKTFSEKHGKKVVLLLSGIMNGMLVLDKARRMRRG